MALPELANSTVETFWENYWCEEDEADDLLFPEEGGDQTNTRQMKIQQYQEEVKEAGMWKVGDQASWIGKLKETLKNALQADWGDLSPKNIDDICEAIERAGRATCYVRRDVNSCTRIDFHEKQIKEQANNDVVKKYHEERLEKAKNGKGASGTGFLMHPKHKKGWFVITNNHVIMDNTEAQRAKVVFDYLEDSSNKDTRVFEVSEIVAKSLRTTYTQDSKTLDFSVLVLKVNNSDADADKFLKKHALGFEETGRVQAGDKQQILDMVKLHFLPMITFSHPHGLAKRISIGKYPTIVEKCPAAHITHDLPTTTGSSGANLLFSFVDEIDGKVFQDWKAGFVHYRHHRAIAWQAIGASLSASLSSTESSHSAGPSTESTREFNNEILKTHNEIRSRHSAPSLKWNSKLASEAQSWAEDLASRNCIQPSSSNDYGENIAYMSGGQLTGRKVTDMWYEKHDQYRYGNPGFSKQTGHFTQIVWQSSKEMGVGTAVSSSGVQFVVARYQPPGNVRGQFPENVKPAVNGGDGKTCCVIL